MKKSRALRALESSAKKGNLTSMYQLYSDYMTGNSDITQDESLSDLYFNKCLRYLESVDEKGNIENKFKLTDLSLFDFRKFKHINISFDRNLTVIIGNNGSGKTSLAQAISKTLSWISSGIEKDGKNGQPIRYTDINNDAIHFADVVTSFSFGKQTLVKGNLSRAIQGAEEKRDSKVSELKLISNVWRAINARKEINLPLFAFYSVSRSHPISMSKQSSEKISNDKRLERFDAYTGALDGAGKFEHFYEWFVSLHKRAVADNSGEIDRLKNRIEKLKILAEDDETFLEILDETKDKYCLALEQKNTNKGIGDLKYLELTIKAIVDVVPSVSNIWVETKSGYDEIYVTNDSEKVNISQLSDGQRIFMSLVADLARRLVLLNTNLPNPMEGQGIVIIDEIELHLHPRWQQGIISSLQSVFPNIQFVVTTHSPQVLSTVDSRCVRVLESDKDGNLIASIPEFQTKGVASADILARIMHTDSIPDVDEANDVVEFSSLVAKGDIGNANELLVKLKEHFGEKHPVIENCLNQLKIYEMKERMKAKRLGKSDA
ncbi:retron Ec78 anti-phage system effector ATPase PtuA [Vibrio campbellii]|uniref:retron Ec78 anti-phage system effector ATPase PtuA n=1 Tax=Vibrio campbellii TaxID=680 RepID=UPI0005EE6263|nr:retron Ec78 anti-phage system effector ATPase PtuA [Vibrio campbellii]